MYVEINASRISLNKEQEMFSFVDDISLFCWEMLFMRQLNYSYSMLPNVCVCTLLIIDNIKVRVDIDYISIIKYKIMNLFLKISLGRNIQNAHKHILKAMVMNKTHPFGSVPFHKTMYLYYYWCLTKMKSKKFHDWWYSTKRAVNQPNSFPPAVSTATSVDTYQPAAPNPFQATGRCSLLLPFQERANKEHSRGSADDKPDKN